MTAKHSDPVFLANARIVRAQVRQAWKYGNEVHCWRRGCIIEPGQPFDVGHLDPDGGHGRENLAPECRRCNRGEGGRRGAAITNARRGATPRPRPRPSVGKGLAPWFEAVFFVLALAPPTSSPIAISPPDLHLIGPRP